MNTNKPFDHEKKLNQPTPFVVACKEFDSKYKDDADCVEELMRILGEGNLYCRYCNSREISRRYGSRTLFCFDCRRGSSGFTYTVLEGIQRPRAYLLALWLIGRGVEFNSHQFHYAARIAYSTALAIIKKIAAIINTDMQKEIETINSSAFIAVFKRRSTETPAQQHPVTEQEEMEKRVQEEREMDCEVFIDETEKKNQSLENLGEREKALFEMLTDEKKHFDDLLYPLGCTVGELCVSIFNLDMIGLIQRHGGDYYTLKKKESESVGLKNKNVDGPMVRDFIDSIGTVFKGISRKCLHLYLSLFWSKVARKRWSLDKLAKACREHPPIRSKDVLNWVCPLIVNIMGTANG